MIHPIRDRRTFQALRTHGVRVRRGPLSVVHLDDGSVPPRVAYALSKRVGNAVARNRLRRRLRARWAELAHDGQVPPGAWLVSAGPEAVTRTPDELRNDVVSLLEALAARRSRSQVDR